MMPVNVSGRILLLPLAASLALVLVGCGAPSAATHQPAAQSAQLAAGRQHEVSSARLAGLPRYFADVVRVSGSVAGEGPLQVRSSATGRLAARQPGYDALAIAAYDSGSRLVIARQAGDRCASRLYRATLSADGRLGRLSRLGPVIHGVVASVADDANASVIGYFAGLCAKSDGGGYLAVLNAHTNKVRRWTGVAMYGSGGTVGTGTALSMSASGRVVVFFGEAIGTGGKDIGQRVWALRTSASAGPLRAHMRTVLSRPNAGPPLSAAVLSPGGKTFYLCAVSTKGTVSAHHTVTQTAVITVRRTSTGASVGTVAKLTATGVNFLGQGLGCPLAVTPNGRYLLAPYKLRYGSSTLVPPVVSAYELGTSSPARRVISFRLPGSGGMSVATGVSIAW
jgi:hypothetical protein